MTERNFAARNRRMTLIGVSASAVGFALFALLGVFGAQSTDIGKIIYRDEQWLPVSGADANSAARSAGVAFDDAQTFWRGRFQSELGRSYTPAQIIYFTAQTPTPCAGAVNASGPFYCYINQTASLDLTFLDLIGGRLFYRGDAGAALLVARVAASHVQNELGSLGQWRRSARGATRAERRAMEYASALQADCLTGVWAHHSADWVAAVDVSFFGRLILAAREVALGSPSGTVQPDGALLGPGTAEERSAAFARGREAGTIAACQQAAGVGAVTAADRG